jgi:hypothetical protein
MNTPNGSHSPGLTAFLRERYPIWGGGVLPTVKGTYFRVDDRNDKDVYPVFCDALVAVPDSDDGELLLVLANVPHNPEVLELLEGHGGGCATSKIGTVTVKVALRSDNKGDIKFLRMFAKAVKRVTGRGQRYPDPQWKWICPRTADAITRLASVLQEFRRQGK